MGDNVVINIVEQPVIVTVNILQNNSTPGESTQNLFIQKTQPAAEGSYMWIELNEDNTIKTIWINK